MKGTGEKRLACKNYMSLLVVLEVTMALAYSGGGCCCIGAIGAIGGDGCEGAAGGR
jgi:hypothetical protein